MSAQTILYVEDEPGDVLLLETCFQQAAAGLSFRVAKDGQIAIDYLSGHGAFADRQEHPLPALRAVGFELAAQVGVRSAGMDFAIKATFYTLPVIVFSASNRETRHPQSLCPLRQRLPGQTLRLCRAFWN